MKSYTGLLLAILVIRSAQWCQREVVEQVDKVYAVDYSSDNKMIAVGLLNNEVYILAVDGKAKLWTGTLPSTPTGMRFNSDSTLLAISYNGGLKIVDSATYAQVTTVTGLGNISDISWNVGSTKLATCNYNSATVNIWTPPTWSGPATSGVVTGQSITSCSFSQASQDIEVGTLSGTVYTLTAASSYASFTTGYNYGFQINDISFKPGSTTYLVSLATTSAFLSTSTGSPMNSEGYSRSGAYSPDGSVFIWSTAQGKVYIYNATSNNNTVLQVFNSSTSSGMISSGFSGDSQSFVVACKDNNIYIFSRNCVTCLYGFYLDYATLTCKFCGDAMDGCGVCPSSGICTSCIQGYYLSADSTQCLSCDAVGLLVGCGSCVDNTICLFCNSGYYLNGTTCAPCGTSVPGCLLCSNSTTCLQCHSDFYLDSSTCTSCSEIDHCLRCNSTTFCIECELGYFVGANDLCEQCSDGCLVCSSATVCSECTLGFYPVAGDCVVCTGNCLACNHAGQCFDCMSGYMLDSTAHTCSACPQGCVTCSDAGACLTCFPGYYPFMGSCARCGAGCETCDDNINCRSCLEGFYFISASSSCSRCIPNFPHCLSCNNVTCIECFVGFYLDGNSECQPCGQAMHACEVCDTGINCNHCVQSHYLAGVDLANDSCLACAIGCSTCQNSTVCTNCAPEFFMNSTACSACVSPCSTCSAELDCLSCVIGFYLDGTDCKPCAADIPACLSCFVVPVDGLVCTNCAVGFYILPDFTCDECIPGCVTCNNSNDCLSCGLGYYLAANLSCMACSPECAECSADGVCESCFLGSYLSVSDTCLTCTDHGCLTCTDSATCDSCTYGSFVNGSSVCQVCNQNIDHCLECNSAMCFVCEYGFVQSADNLTCQNCAQFTGCLNCQDLTTCLICLAGFYLDTDSSCKPCGEGCTNCQLDVSSNLVCLECGFGYYLDSPDCKLCRNSIVGCDACTEDGANCLKCTLAFYIDTVVTQDICTLCENSIDGCIFCESSAVCVGCKGGFFLDSDICKLCSLIDDNCLFCEDGSTCATCKGGYYEDAGLCTLCNTNNVGCEKCSDFDTCEKCLNGFYLDGEGCSLCDTANPGCFFCDDAATCLECGGGFYMDGGSQCQPCQMEGCQICQETSPTTCETCNGQYYMSSPNVCTLCRVTMPHCITCTSSTDCVRCDSGYYFDGTDCLICSEAMVGCNICDSPDVCLDCKSLYFINSSSACQLCAQPISGCAFCTNDTECVSCMSGFYLTAANQCDPCTNIHGCLLCKDDVQCIYCDTSFYLVGNDCLSCIDDITGCYSCTSSTDCTSCLGGYMLVSGVCQYIDLDAANTDVDELTLKTFYVDPETLRHQLYSLGMTFTKKDIDWQAEMFLTLESADGTLVDLTIKKVEWTTNDYTLIIYTNNPLNIDSSNLKMPFARRRRLQSLELNSHTQLGLSQAGKNAILPNYSHAGAFTVSYDLNNSEFYASYVSYNHNFILEAIGVVLVVILYIKYSVKALKTVPESHNLGNIIGHILAFKVGALLLYPTFMEYIQFCSGFMLPDFPFVNHELGMALGDARDETPVAYTIFYVNMSLASMYFLACLVILALCGLTVLIGKKLNQQTKMFSYLNFLYAYFIFGVIFAGCGSLQGSILNPVEQLTVNGMFYIMGIVLYVVALCEIIYRMNKDVKLHFWRVRIFVKATLLSLSHFSPIYLLSASVLIDLVLIIIEFKICQYPPRFARWWIFANVTVNLALLLLIYLPVIQLSLYTITLLLILVIVAEGVMHYKEMQPENQDLKRSLSSPTSESSEKAENDIKKLDLSEKEYIGLAENNATLYIEEEDNYHPFSPIKPNRDRANKRKRDEIRSKIKQAEEKKNRGNDDSQSFTFTMEEYSQNND